MGTIVNPQTQQELDRLHQRLPHALLVVGGEQLGSLDIAKHIAKNSGADSNILLPEKNEKVDLENGVIGIDQVRNLYESTRSKKSSKHITIITAGDRMTHQAQNAFLKLLEEPNQNTHFIIVASNPGNLLDTVLSRVERLIVKPITLNQSDDLINRLAPNDSKKQTQLRYIAAGMPNELKKLAEDEDYFKERSESIRKAMTILRGSDYDKLKIMHDIKDDRAEAIRLVGDVMMMLKRLINENPAVDLISRLDTAIKAQSDLERNGNVRLVLLRSFL